MLTTIFVCLFFCFVLFSMHVHHEGTFSVKAVSLMYKGSFIVELWCLNTA